jgi:flagellar biosynthesis protein FlhB
MSENEQGGDRTEAPSGRRSEQAYQEGNVAVSRDVISAACLAAGSLALFFLGAGLLDSLVKLVAATLARLSQPEARDLLPQLIPPSVRGFAICAAVAVAGALATLAQTRFGFWPELALPRFDRVFSGARFSRMLNKEMLADLGLVLVKIVTLILVLWWALAGEFVTLPRMLYLGPDGLMASIFDPLGRALVKALTVLLVIAGADLAVTRFRHRGRLKMTKDELKREAREEDGDPFIRSRRRRKHRELVKGRIAVEVPRADVVVVNPTHFAVALRYRPGEDRAPRVTAKGQGEHAERIRELARAHGIPVVENVALARLLYRRVKVGRAVPTETFKAVAAVLAFVYRALGRAPSEAHP